MLLFFSIAQSSRRSSPQSKPTGEDVIYSVELNKGSQSLGISLHGTRMRIFPPISLLSQFSLGSERPGQPIIISHVKEGGVAHRLINYYIINIK